MDGRTSCPRGMGMDEASWSYQSGSRNSNSINLSSDRSFNWLASDGLIYRENQVVEASE